MMPCSSSVFSRSARMLEEMPSSDFVSNSRKCRRLPNIMSRMIRRLHLSPSTSSERLIGQPERLVSVMFGSRRAVGAPSKNCLQYCTGCLRIQPVANRNRFFKGGAAMARLIMWNLMTLDGFVEGPNRDISFHSDVWGEELEKLSIEQGKSAGGLMFGRVTYELMAGHWPNEEGEVADFMNALPKYVFSRTLRTSGWNNTQVFAADESGTVARLKRDNARDIFLFGS